MRLGGLCVQGSLFLLLWRFGPSFFSCSFVCLFVLNASPLSTPPLPPSPSPSLLSPKHTVTIPRHDRYQLSFSECKNRLDQVMDRMRTVTRTEGASEPSRRSASRGRRRASSPPPAVNPSPSPLPLPARGRAATPRGPLPGLKPGVEPKGTAPATQGRPASPAPTVPARGPLPGLGKPEAGVGPGKSPSPSPSPPRRGPTPGIVNRKNLQNQDTSGSTPRLPEPLPVRHPRASSPAPTAAAPAYPAQPAQPQYTFCTNLCALLGIVALVILVGMLTDYTMENGSLKEAIQVAQGNVTSLQALIEQRQAELVSKARESAACEQQRGATKVLDNNPVAGGGEQALFEIEAGGPSGAPKPLGPR